MRILHFCHNDPRLHPGGTEVFSKNLHDHYWQEMGHESFYAAATFDHHRPRPPGTLFQSYERDSRSFLVWTHDQFLQEMLQNDTFATAPQIAELLRHTAPDVVHIHHLLHFGGDLLALIKRYQPNAKIVVTLHDYVNICLNDGVMVTSEGKLCSKALVHNCHKCAPHIETSIIKRRELSLKAHLSLADQLLSPSEFLRQRFIDWGISADKIAVMRNGIPKAQPLPETGQENHRPRNRFAIFGNVSEMKGTLVALNAARKLAKEGLDFSLEVHGGLHFRGPEFTQSFKKALKKGQPHIRHMGTYRPEELPRRMAGVDWVIIPSVWWENAPLVIQEAFSFGRPVICSDIGGMAEAVRHDVDGLHFPVGQVEGLANVMRQAIAQDSWQRLSDGISPVRTVPEAAEDHITLYRRLIAEKSNSKPPVRKTVSKPGKPVAKKKKAAKTSVREPAPLT